jgi:hypothetical protein
LLAAILTAAALWLCVRSIRRRTARSAVVWGIGTIVGVVIAVAARVDVVDALHAGSVGASVFVGLRAVFGAIIGLVSFSILLAGTVAVAFAAGFAYGGAFAGGVAAAFVAFLSSFARRSSWEGYFQASFFLITGCTCLAAAYELAPLAAWRRSGPLVLFLGLLAVINTPFDWASLGVTRALLRRGLELGGWWPYALALADAVCAVVIITIFTVASVLSIQFFDDLAVHSAGDDARLLPLDKLFDDIKTKPSAPEFWWVYAMLLSTMIPSLVNLAISGASLLRGVPWVSTLLLWSMPEESAPARHDRPWIALLLTLQLFIGAVIGIIAQGVLARVLGHLVALATFRARSGRPRACSR